MSKSRKKKKDSFKIIYMILGIEMLVTVAVIGYFGYHYGSILLAGFKSAKASISSQTPVQDPGYPIDVDGQAPTIRYRQTQKWLRRRCLSQLVLSLSQ